MRVEDIMARGAHTCMLQDSLNRAAQVMWENDCGCLPVVDGEGKVVAMITDRDICMAAYTQGRPLSDMLVSSAASHEVFMCRETDSVGAVEAIMRKHQVRRLPVVDPAGRPIGMLSMNDLARHAYKTPHRTDGLNPEFVVRTLAGICEPVHHETVAVAAE